MGDLRPGSKIRFWSPKFKNKPAVEPPSLLRLLSGLCIFSIVGVLLYAVSLSLRSSWGVPSGSEGAAYVAVLHFLLPLCITYTIATNSALSRPLIAAYFVVLYSATVTGKGFLGGLGSDDNIRLIIATGVFVLLMAWLFRSPRMRIYYVLLLGKAVPPDLEDRAYELAATGSLSPRMKRALEWLADHLETAVMLGFIVLVLFVWLTWGM